MKKVNIDMKKLVCFVIVGVLTVFSIGINSDVLTDNIVIEKTINRELVNGKLEIVFTTTYTNKNIVLAVYFTDGTTLYHSWTETRKEIYCAKDGEIILEMVENEEGEY